MCLSRHLGCCPDPISEGEGQIPSHIYEFIKSNSNKLGQQNQLIVTFIIIGFHSDDVTRKSLEPSNWESVPVCSFGQEMAAPMEENSFADVLEISSLIGVFLLWFHSKIYQNESSGHSGMFSDNIEGKLSSDYWNTTGEMNPFDTQQIRNQTLL